MLLGSVLGQSTGTCAEDDSRTEASGPAVDEEVKAAQKLLQGTWVSVGHQRNGKPYEQPHKMRLVIHGDGYQLNEGTLSFIGTYQLDLTKTPKRISLVTRDGMLHASYALQEGELKLCFGSKPTLAAPEGVETVPGDGRLLTIFAPQLVRILERHGGPVRTAVFSPDGKRIASGSGWPKGDGTIRLWDVENGKEIRRIDVRAFVSDSIERDQGRRAGDVGQLVFTPDGHEIIACGIGGFVVMWNVDTGELTRRFEGAGDFTCPIAISPDGRTVVSVGQEHTMIAWDVASGERLRNFGKHDGQIRSLAVCPDSDRVLSGGRDQMMRLWDLKSGEEIRRFQLEGIAESVAFSPDGRQAMAGISAPASVLAASPICIWNLETGSRIRRIEAHPHGVTCAVFSKDGRRILSCGYNNQVRLWDVESGSRLALFQGHRNWIRSVAFSPDGQLGLSAGGGQGNAKKMLPGDDFGIRLWDLGLAVDEGANADLLDKLVLELMDKYHVPGVSLAGIEDRRVAWDRQYGVRQVGSPEKVDRETVFEACSMSKTPLAYLAMRLVERGKLDLDRPLVEYLDEPYLADDPLHEKITARMVLSHTTGFPNWRKGGSQSTGPLSVEFEPGSKFGYSGEGYLYLQRVVEHISGTPFEQYVQQELFGPLGMTISSYEWQDRYETLAAAGHDAEGRVKVDRRHFTRANAGYSLYTTPCEYAQYLVEYLNPDRSAPHSLSKASLAAMFTPTTETTGRKPVRRTVASASDKVFWGLGWAIDKTERGGRIYHSGSNGTGFRCYSQFDPVAGTGLVIMTNSTSGRELWEAVVEAIAP